MNLSHRLEYLGFRLLFGLFASLPLRWALRVGAWLGELAYLLDYRDRRIAMINLGLAFPERTPADRRRILRTSCRNLGRVVAEFCHLPQLTPALLEQRIEVADRDRWQSALALAAQRGAVVVTAHFGNWELLAYAHGLWGHPVTLVHRPLRNRAIDQFIHRLRAAVGTRAIAKKAAAKEAIRTLRRKEILVVPSDQNQPVRDGVFVDFFAVPACTNAGAARLAAITGAPIIPVFLVRQGETERHRLVVLPTIEPIVTDDRAADAIVNTQRCSDVIESTLRQFPEQWIWFHKRWKNRPAGLPRIYP